MGSGLIPPDHSSSLPKAVDHSNFSFPLAGRHMDILERWKSRKSTVPIGGKVYEYYF